MVTSPRQSGGSVNPKHTFNMAKRVGKVGQLRGAARTAVIRKATRNVGASNAATRSSNQNQFNRRRTARAVNGGQARGLNFSANQLARFSRRAKASTNATGRANGGRVPARLRRLVARASGSKGG